jgi:hypothetical protein
MSYLLETPACYYFRIRVPKDLQSVVKKREIKKSLKTADRRKAMRLAAVYATQCYDIFETLRSKDMSKIHFFPTSFTVQSVKRLADGGVELDDVRTDGTEADAKALANFVNMISHPPTPSAPSADEQPLLLSQACKSFLIEKESLAKNKCHKTEIPKHFELLVRVLGDCPVRTFSRSDALAAFNIIKRLPANINKNPRFRGKSINQILALNEPAREASTINATMTCASSLFDWMTVHGHVARNIFTDLRMPRKIGGRDRFDLVDLKKIFSDEIFTKHIFKYAYRFWVPLIALHSGMRMNEILQLRP